MSDNKITISPSDEAIYRFDAELNIEPTRMIAERIALHYGILPSLGDEGGIIDAISHAIEDARDLGGKRMAVQLKLLYDCDHG